MDLKGEMVKLGQLETTSNNVLQEEIQKVAQGRLKL